MLGFGWYKGVIDVVGEVDKKNGLLKNALKILDTFQEDQETKKVASVPSLFPLRSSLHDLTNDGTLILHDLKIDDCVEMQTEYEFDDESMAYVNHVKKQYLTIITEYEDTKLTLSLDKSKIIEHGGTKLTLSPEKSKIII